MTDSKSKRNKSLKIHNGLDSDNEDSFLNDDEFEIEPKKAFTDHDEEDSNSKDSNKKKRKKKNDSENRMHLCDCGKSYQSLPALINHKKTKHENENNNKKRGRGRPKKNPSVVFSNEENIEERFSTFFNEKKRQINQENTGTKVSEFNELIFHEIFINHNIPEFNYKKTEDHYFLSFIEKADNKEKDLAQTNSEKIRSKSCDSVMYEYLNLIFNECNHNYFIFVFKFLILFRECINKYKNIEMINRRIILNEDIPEEYKEYTQFFNADQVPELCNEFVTEYLETNEYFGMNSEDERNEIMEIIQHFCYWLFKKSYTSSKLTLVSNNQKKEEF